MVPARFIQGEFDLQEAEHLGMTIKAICTQGKQVARYPLCSVAFRTQRRGGNLKTVIPFLLTVSCAFRDVKIQSLTALLPIHQGCHENSSSAGDLGFGFCGDGIRQTQIFFHNYSDLSLSQQWWVGLSEIISHVFTEQLSGSCIFYWPTKSKRSQSKGHCALCSRRWWFKLQFYLRRLKMLKILWNISKNPSHQFL